MNAMSNNTNPSSPCCGCQAKPSKLDQARRDTIKMMSLGSLSIMSFMGTDAKAQTAPLLMVDADAEQDFKPLRPSDLALGKPLLVYPFDTQTGKPLNEKRVNKLVVIRLQEDQMETATKGRSAGGVLAYSALCTHQACDVKTWLAKEKVLVCFCHASKFDLLDGAKVVDGPASRPLPSFNLKLEGEFLALASS